MSIRTILYRSRLALLLSVVCAIVAALVADHSGVPTDSLQVGEVAHRTIQAPFSFNYQDLRGFEQQRELARQSAPPVFLYDSEMTTELRSRVKTAFEAARTRIAVLSGKFQAGEEDTDQDDVEPWVPSDDQLDELVEYFLADLGVHIPREYVVALIELSFPNEAEVSAIEWVSKAVAQRFILAERSALPADRRPLLFIPLVTDGTEFLFTDYEALVDPEEVRNNVTLAAVGANGPWVAPAASIARALVQANVRFDQKRTEKRAADDAAAVSPQVLTVKRGATLFREGDILTADEIDRYTALQDSRQERPVWAEFITLLAFLTLVLAGLYTFGANHIRRFDTSFRSVAAVGALTVLTAALARFVVAIGPSLASMVGSQAEPASIWFVTPVAGAAILVRLLVGVEWAVLFTLAASVICGLIMDFQALYVIYFAMVGFVGASAVEHTRERMLVLKAGAFTGMFGALAVVIFHFVQLFVLDGELSLATTIRPFWSVVFALTGGLLSAFLVLGTMPLFETLGFVTDYRLQELASLNHPLLRQLMLKAPGTYHHSVVVGTLAEAACEEIGANSMQAKIASYFHDIGKMEQPMYFIENQRGTANRHSSLDPHTSARMIIAHVVDGGRMATEHGLPKPIVDNIFMHHGTGLLAFFYRRALQDAEDPETVSEADFRYPGPKPNTREAGVIMLADKVEAATRTIKHPNEENIRAMIQRIVNSVIADDQFSDCPLTVREISRTTETFVSVLTGIYHQRIQYADTQDLSSAPAQAAPSVGAVTSPQPAREAVQTGDANQRGVALDFKPGSGRTSGASLRRTGWLADDDLDEDTDYEAVRNLPTGSR